MHVPDHTSSGLNEGFITAEPSTGVQDRASGDKPRGVATMDGQDRLRMETTNGKIRIS
jgi:hypothetical protein